MKTRWAVMRLCKIEDMVTSLGMRVGVEPGGIMGFVPVFETKEEALSWADDESAILMQVISQEAEDERT